ncbi:MAG TPA: hypothetical protein VGI40_19790 [Pirellulaceae bacterium]|jgi:hypothetical protein
MLWGALGFVAMFFSMAFVAALLLSCGQLFCKLPRRRRLRLPTAAELEELRARPRAKIDKPKVGIFFRLLTVPFAVIMFPLLLLVLIPAFAAMWLCVVCQNFRYVRRATYRVLRRRNVLLARYRSYPTGLAVFMRKIACLV